MVSTRYGSRALGPTIICRGEESVEGTQLPVESAGWILGRRKQDSLILYTPHYSGI
jgi:hypothetical protein